MVGGCPVSVPRRAVGRLVARAWGDDTRARASGPYGAPRPRHGAIVVRAPRRAVAALDTAPGTVTPGRPTEPPTGHLGAVVRASGNASAP